MWVTVEPLDDVHMLAVERRILAAEGSLVCCTPVVTVGSAITSLPSVWKGAMDDTPIRLFQGHSRFLTSPQMWSCRGW